MRTLHRAGQKSAIVSIRVTAELHQKLKQLCTFYNMSQSAVINVAVQKSLIQRATLHNRDRRQFPRHEEDIPAMVRTYSAGKSLFLPCRITEISQSGLGLLIARNPTTNAFLSEAELFDAILTLPGQGAPLILQCAVKSVTFTSVLYCQVGASFEGSDHSCRQAIEEYLVP